MDFKAFTRGIVKKGSFSASLFLFAGEEDFIKEEGVRLLREKILGKKSREAAFLRISGIEEGDWARLCGEVQTPSLFSPAKIIVVESGEEILKSRAEELAKLVRCAARGVLLVIFLNKEECRGISALVKEGGMVVACKKIYEKPPPWLKKAPHEGPLTAWVRDRVKELGGNISKEDAYGLIQRVGTDMSELDREITKLVQFAGSSRRIGREEICRLTQARRRHTRFELTDTLAQRHGAGCVRILRSLFRNGIEDRGKLLRDEQRIASILLNGMERKWRDLLEGRLFLEKGGTAEKLMEQKRIPAFLRQKKLPEYDTFPAEELAGKYPLFLRADKQLKRGDIPSPVVLETLVLNLCSKRKVKIR